MGPFNQLQPADATLWITAEKSPRFLRGPLEPKTEAENMSVVNLLQSAAMVAEKLLEKLQKNSLDQTKIYLPGVLCKILNRKTLFAETFCFWSNLPFFTSCWLAHSQLSRNVLYCYFPTMRLVNFV